MAQRELSIILSLKDEASKEMQNFSSKIQDLQPEFKKLAVMGTAAFTAVTGAVGLSIKSYVDAGDAIQKMGIRTGFSAKSLSELKYAADLSGTSIEDMEGSINRMNKVLSGADDESKGATASIEKLGLKVNDILKLSPEDRFFKLANAVADLRDPGLRAAAAMEIFGKQGTMLLPMLSEGAAGIARMREEANSLGLVFDEQAAKSAAEFGDEMTKLHGTVTGIQYALAEAMLPVIRDFVKDIQPLIGEVREWIKANPELVTNLVLVAAAVTALIAGVGTLGVALGGVMTFLSIITGPIGLVALAIAGLIYIIWSANESIKIWQNDSALVIAGVKAYWEDFKNFFKGIWDSISLYFSQVWDGMKIIFNEAIDALVNKIQPLIDMINRVVSGAKSIGSTIVSGVKSVGKAIGVNDAIISPDGNVITTHPDDYLIATKDPGSLGGKGGVTINVYGDVSGQDLVDKVMDALAMNIKYQVRI